VVSVKPSHARPQRQKWHFKRVKPYVVLATALVTLATGIVTLITVLNTAPSSGSQKHSHRWEGPRNRGNPGWRHSSTLGSGPLGLLKPGQPMSKNPARRRYRAGGGPSGGGQPQARTNSNSSRAGQSDGGASMAVHTQTLGVHVSGIALSLGMVEAWLSNKTNSESFEDNCIASWHLGSPPTGDNATVEPCTVPVRTKSVLEPDTYKLFVTVRFGSGETIYKVKVFTIGLLRDSDNAGAPALPQLPTRPCGWPLSEVPQMPGIVATVLGKVNSSPACLGQGVIMQPPDGPRSHVGLALSWYSSNGHSLADQEIVALWAS
jgi:hypothetical protein